MKSPIVVSTRILDGKNSAIVEASKIKWIQHDFISILAVSFYIDQLYDSLLFTSQNAVKAIQELQYIDKLKEKECFCVGENTKAMLEQLGFKVVAWAHYAKDLGPILVKSFSDRSISFFNGNLRSEVLPGFFDRSNLVYNEFQVYQTVLTPVVVSEKPSGICFYSPSGVRSYLQQNSITDQICFCIGETTAQALHDVTDNIVLAQKPTIEKTLQACVTYYK